jgi:inner membrane transporter RhtA
MSTLAQIEPRTVAREVVGRVPAPLLLITAAFSVQSGAALATTLFEEAGALGTVWVRTAFAAVVLALLARPPRRTPWLAGPLRYAVGLGVALASVNSLFYLAIDRVPLGVAVTVEFLGPLAVAVAGSRRRLDFLWIVLAGAGVALLARPPRRTPWLAGPLRYAVGLGVALASVNSLFYLAIDRVPLGVAVTVEFLGPLAVAVAGSRRRLDFLWIVLAGAGVALLGSPTVDVDRLGLLLALAAGVFWAAYIVIGKRLGATWPLQRGLAVSMALAAVLTAPLGLASGGTALVDVRLLLLGLAVAVLASVVPYVLELAALRRLRTSTFGILMSLGPAVAALCGAVFLGQRLGSLELLAIAFVVAASVGANRGANSPAPVGG